MELAVEHEHDLDLCEQQHTIRLAQFRQEAEEMRAQAVRQTEETLKAQFLDEFARSQEELVAKHESELASMQEAMEERNREVMESSRIQFEQNKYEDRVKLIKKMHEEEISEIRRVNRMREEHLEAQIASMQKERDKLYAAAKEEAREEEKRKRAKFQLKVERIKRQEIAEMRR